MPVSKPSVANPIMALARKAILDLKPYSSARSLVTAGSCFLDANESPWAPFPGGEESAGLNRYPEPQPARLRAALSELYGVAENSIFIGRGADEAIDTLVRVFCEAGQDQILICPPTYGVYEIAAQIQGAGVVRVPLDKDFKIDVQRVLASWQPSVKIVFLCSPNNPTGNVVAAAAIETLCAGLASRAVVVLDEAYLEFSKTPSFARRLAEFPNLIVLRTLSKALSLAGARCGVALGNSEVVALMQKTRAPYPLSTPSVRAVLRALSDEGQELARERLILLLTERAWLLEQLRASRAVEQVYPTDANFVLVRVPDAAALVSRCRAAGVIIRDRSLEPGLKNCVRISVGNRDENEQLLAQLKGSLEK